MNNLIIIKIIGGLGNQMFQYALGRKLAIKNNATLKFDICGFRNYALRQYDLKYFNIEGSIATPDDLSNVCFPSNNYIHLFGKYFKILTTNTHKIRYFKEKNFNFQPEIVNLEDNIYLDGYWQSEKYFSDINDVIKKEFTVKKQPNSINKSFIEKIEGSESVSIHIRRGDYATNTITTEIHGLLDIEYYQNAIKFMIDK
ncbi:MAG: hypothetical protein APR54_09795, partial [Candidatus Cloacimonas sp. SDB]